MANQTESYFRYQNPLVIPPEAREFAVHLLAEKLPEIKARVDGDINLTLFAPAHHGIAILLIVILFLIALLLLVLLIVRCLSFCRSKKKSSPEQTPPLKEIKSISTESARNNAPLRIDPKANSQIKSSDTPRTSSSSLATQKTDSYPKNHPRNQKPTVFPGHKKQSRQGSHQSTAQFDTATLQWDEGDYTFQVNDRPAVSGFYRPAQLV